MKPMTGIGLVVLGCLAVSPAQAALSQAFESDFEQGNIVTFEGLATYSDVGATYAAQGATFAGFQAYDYSLSNLQGNTLGCCGDTAAALVNFAQPEFAIDFGSAVFRAGFYTGGSSAVTLPVSFLLDGTVVESTTVTSNSGFFEFFGFESAGTFDRIEFAGFSPGVLVDNVRFDFARSADVPAPSGLALLGLGLAVLGGAMRGRHRAR
ncbi:hypothetical protein B5C34_02510 [Pacificimonas flava]|uniref:PEP-CTERM protein-sorting domain-containing protein n=2 Tax=Pacificimonas TaxID=1960290 RepID=A0A219B291_9SPHN|nr:MULTISPECIES: hypothetical protein [Pacificimonas]MBZ6377907.1 hypothetical protein [Pacificimonas aurantium]OWV32435.1 hypothetical protein B5C34_02510 [Pacificimonas flava]